MRQIGWALGEVARRLGVSDRPVRSLWLVSIWMLTLSHSLILLADWCRPSPSPIVPVGFAKETIGQLETVTESNV
jgi:hypothetical protein